MASDSDLDHNLNSEESGGPVTTFIVPQFDVESPSSHIPTTIAMSDSDSEEGRQSGSVILAGSAFGRDPVTGVYTAASFAHFQDNWV